MKEIDKELLEKTNGAKKDERRYIAGILQFIVGIVMFLASSSLYVGAEEHSDLVSSLVVAVSISVFAIYDGVHMVRTSTDWASRSTEITNDVLAVLLVFLFFTSFNFSVLPMFIMFVFAFIVLFLVGSSIKNETLKARMKAKKQWLERNK